MQQSRIKESLYSHPTKSSGAIKLMLSMAFWCMLMLVGPNAYAQELKTPIGRMENTTIKSVFNEIEKNSDYVLVFNNNIKPEIEKKVTVRTATKKITAILDEILARTPLSYKIVDKQIIIVKNETKTPPVKAVGGQQKNTAVYIKGNVTDIHGEPLIGVSVTIAGDGPTEGTVTNTDGNYTIKVNDKYAMLKFSYIGFVPKEEKVENRKIINIVMLEEVGQLDEVVVVGYGTQKKESVVGSISTIEPAKLSVSTSRSMSNNLAGNIAGVIGVQRSGEPGYDNSTFWIRGISTFQKAGGDPLVLVDGIERSLDNIDIQEIESFSVLKDAAASAVYGVRGANGVILINTKRGKIGKPTVNFRTEYAITQPTKLPKYIGAADYMQLLDDIRTENGQIALYTDRIENTLLNTDPDLYPDVNWLDAISKNHASNMRATLDISGGTERLRYSFVAAYYDESGILVRDKKQEWDPSIKVQRYNVRSNVDMDLTTTTLLRFNIGGYMQDRKAPNHSITDIFYKAFETPPFVHPTQYSSGEIPKRTERENPWALATQTGYQRNSSSRIETLFSIEQDLKFITPGLKVKGVFSFDRYAVSTVKRNMSPTYYAPATGRDYDGNLLLDVSVYGQEFLGHAKEAEWGDRSTYLEGNISYSRIFGKHSVDAMFLYNQRNYDNGDTLPYRNQGIAGRASYIYDGKYIAEFNFGYNGSENFAKGKRFGFFPSVAIGWVVSEEAFMKRQNVVSRLKLRGSYGRVGNDRLDGRRFAYLSTIEYNGDDGYAWGPNKEIMRGSRYEGEFGIPSLTWETVDKMNAGIELGFLQGMIEFQADFFNERRKDIFMKRKSIPTSAGFNIAPWANFGRVDNNGIDVSLNFNKQFGKDLFLSFMGTFTYAKNKIKEYDEAYTVVGTPRAHTGHPVNQLFGLQAEGLFTEDDFIDVKNGILKEGIPEHTFETVRPGDIKYKDLNHDGKITELDKTAIGGTKDPEIVYGFGLSGRYKNFDFGCMFQGTGRTFTIIGRSDFFLPGSGNGALGNYFTNIDDRWTVENPRQDVFYPRASAGPNKNNLQESTWWLRNMSFLRMKNLEIGYSLPKIVNRKISSNNIRFFLRGTNLLTFSKFKLWDPEVDNAQVNGNSYPIMKTYSAGIEINF